MNIRYKLSAAGKSVTRFLEKACLYSMAALVVCIVIPCILLMTVIAVVMRFLLAILGAVIAAPRSFRKRLDRYADEAILDVEDNIRG